MNILAVNGSYKKNGMVSSLIESFIKGFTSKDKNAQVKIVNLTDLDFKFCNGCNVCQEKGRKDIIWCPFNDGINDILKDMLNADRLVLASPVYCFSLTAIMKKFIERCLPLAGEGKGLSLFSYKIKKGKKGMVILSTGAPYPFNSILGITKNPEKLLRWYSRFSGCEKISVLKAGAMETSEKVKTAFMVKAFRLGIKFAS